MKKNSAKYMSEFSLKLYNICQRIPAFRYFKVILYYVDFFLLLFIRKPKYVDNGKKKILIIYNYAFGDGIIWLCSMKHLRELYAKKDYHITLICQKGLNTLYENEDIFDEVIGYDLTKATYNLKTRYKLYKLLRKTYYDIVLDPIGCAECTTNVFMSRAAVAKNKITILDATLDNYMCPKYIYNRIYTEIFKLNEPGVSLIEFYAFFLRKLGLKKFKVKLEPIRAKKIQKISLPKEYFIIFPSSSTKLKKWPIERYAQIAHRIYKKTKLPILFCGTASDIEAINELKEKTKDIPQFDIVGETSLLEFIYVVKKAKFVVTNDTSTYHIAVTNEIPVAIITGGYTYNRYVEYKFDGNEKYKKPYIIVHKMPCFNCDNKCSKINRSDKIWPCLDAITVDYAWKIIEKMIDEL